MSIAAVLMVALTCDDSTAARIPEGGIINAGQLHIRLKPTPTSPSTHVLSPGARVKVIKHLNNGWLEIKSGHISGYIRNHPQYVHLFREKRKRKKKKEGSAKINTTGVEAEIKRQRDQIGQITRKIKKQRNEIRSHEKKEKEIINDLITIDRLLSQIGTEVNKLKHEIHALNGEINSNQQDMEALKKEIRREKHHITKRLVALYKMGRLGTVTHLASADNMYEWTGRKTALGRILDADAEIMDNYMSKLGRLDHLRHTLETQKKRYLLCREEYESRLTSMENKKSERSDLLSRVINQKSLAVAAVKSLEQAAVEMKQTLTSLDQGFRRADNSSPSNNSNFTDCKGRLKMPVKGSIVSRFGQVTDKKFNIVTFQNGIDIKADKGEPIQAVEGGTVLFADWLKGYGNLIIINHGNSYYTLYAHADELFKAKGDMVETREVIATVGDTGLFGKPGLHFEIRHRGTPVDPLKWLAEK